MDTDSLVFNEETNHFEALVTNEIGTYDVTICDLVESEEDVAIEIMNNINNWVVSHIEDIKKYASDELLELKNRDWLEHEEDEKPLTEKEFTDRLEIDGILMFAEGPFEVYFNDNDIFWGHYVRVDIDELKEIFCAEIAE